MNNKSCCVILLAAGKSKRFKNKIKKQLCKVYNKTLLQYNLDVFSSIKFVKQIVVVVAKKDFFVVKNLCKKYKKKIIIVEGGKERYDSVYNAVKIIRDDAFKYVIIHDVARPLITKKFVNKCLTNIKNYDGLIPGLSPVDTVKTINKNSEVEKTLDRQQIVLVQTPQVFKIKVVKHIYSKNVLNKWKKKYKITDDAQLAELEGFKIKVIPGEKQNIKVTTKEDINLIKFFLKNN